MQIYTIDTGFFKLDGGAMFGVVPKSIWKNLNPADENNMCTWAMRCLLIEDGKQLTLVDTGLGNKQDDKFFSHYYLHGEATLLKSIEKAGFSADEITDVVLTHLHFDHVGGAVSCNADKTRFFPTFKNAIYHTNQQHWDWAMHPNPREKASFLQENLLPLQESGQLKSPPLALPEGGGVGLVSLENSSTLSFFIPPPSGGVRGGLLVNGHTEAMMLPIIKFGDKTLLYCADLIPSAGHIPVPYVMAYDMRPLVAMEEKNRILQQACEEGWILMFEHDPIIECATLQQTEKGIRIQHKGRLADF
ncbi:MAG: MBL fold metallo-hydrolase [Verrucomicrobia bacterium]|nr:MBL fold metallo-hydrolase [Cytophagales bacterium]